jgi:hypothetical protein
VFSGARDLAPRCPITRAIEMRLSGKYIHFLGMLEKGYTSLRLL